MRNSFYLTKRIVAVLLICVMFSTINAQAATKLSKPGNFKGKVNITEEYLTELTVTWDKVKGAEGYQVYYREANHDGESEWEEWSLYEKTKKRSAVASIIDGEFQIRVRAYKGSTYSKFTNTITVLGGVGIVKNTIGNPRYKTVDLADMKNQGSTRSISYADSAFNEQLNLEGTNLEYTYSGWTLGEGLVKAYALDNNGSEAIIETTVAGSGELSFQYGMSMEVDAPDIDEELETSLTGVSKIEFYIDDKLTDLSNTYEIGEAGTSYYYYKIASGTHKLKWVYSYVGGLADPYKSYCMLADIDYQQVNFEPIKLSKTSTQLYVNESTTLVLANADQEVTWKSSNSKIATVSNQGKVTGKSAGKATITATTNGNDYSCVVTVKKVTADLLYNQLLEKGQYVYNYFGYDMKMQLNYFYFMDLNNDGKKELIVSAINKAVKDEFYYLAKGTALVFTVKNNKLSYMGNIQSCIDDKGLMYHKKYKGIVAEPDAGSGGRGYSYELYKVQKDLLKRTNNCDWHYEGAPYKNYYNINNKSTTKAKYNAYLKKYFNENDYVHYSFYKNTESNRNKYLK